MANALTASNSRRSASCAASAKTYASGPIGTRSGA
jgi:hypothetical protein